MWNYLRLLKLLKIRSDIEQDSLFSPRQGHSTDKQNEQHEVGVGGREVNNLQNIDVSIKYSTHVFVQHVKQTALLSWDR